MLGFTGWYVWHAKQSADKTLTADNTSTPTFNKQSTGKTSTVTQQSGPYTGWKTATLKYEKITYNYPANWNVKDLSFSSPKGKGCIYPGSDEIYLTSPSNEQVAIRTGIDCIGDGSAAAFSSTTIKSLGQNLYLVLENNIGIVNPTAAQPSYACLARSTKPDTPMDFKSKNIFDSGNGVSTLNYFCYYPYNLYGIQTSTDPSKKIPDETAASITNSKDYATAKLIFESMHY